MNTLIFSVIFICMGLFTIRYVHLIVTKTIEPALATWMILCLGTVLSLVTFFVSGDGTWQSGILNITDMVVTLAVVVSIVFWGSLRFKLRSFEKFYLFGVSVILVFWFITRDAFVSNLLVQLLMSIGYGPTIHNLYKEKRNTESFFAWGLAFIAICVAVIPGVMAGSILSIVYAGKGVPLIGTVLTMMVYYSFKKRKSGR